MLWIYALSAMGHVIVKTVKCRFSFSKKTKTHSCSLHRYLTLATVKMDNTKLSCTLPCLFPEPHRSPFMVSFSLHADLSQLQILLLQKYSLPFLPESPYLHAPLLSPATSCSLESGVASKILFVLCLGIFPSKPQHPAESGEKWLYLGCSYSFVLTR